MKDLTSPGHEPPERTTPSERGRRKAFRKPTARQAAQLRDTHQRKGREQTRKAKEQTRVAKEQTRVAKEQTTEGEEHTKPTERAKEGYDRAAAAQADSVAIVEGLKTITHELRNLAATLQQESDEARSMQAEQLQLAEHQLKEYEQLNSLIKEMPKRGIDQDPTLGFSAVAQTEALKGATKLATKRWPGRAWDTVWDTLQAIVPYLWNMIRHLLKVKEWSVTGQVSTPVLDFAQASISVTFG